MTFRNGNVDAMKGPYECGKNMHRAQHCIRIICIWQRLTHRNTQKHAETHRTHRITQKHIETQRQTETDRDRQRQTEKNRDRQRQAETDRDRQRQTETDTFVLPHFLTVHAVLKYLAMEYT